jgi:hypothetical protein
VRAGADVSFLGIAGPDDYLELPDGFTSDGTHTPIYERSRGYDFTIVVEGKPGPSRKPVGRSAFKYDPSNPGVRPDLQVIVSNPLGEDPTPEVCDNIPGEIGGVPAAMSFDQTQPISDAINDLACRFVNGNNVPVARSAGEACTKFRDGEYRFAGLGSTVQFCWTATHMPIELAFPRGDTVVTVRLRDRSEATGPPARLIVRVLK